MSRPHRTESPIRQNDLAGMLLRGLVLTLGIGLAAFCSAVLQNLLSQTPVTLLHGLFVFFMIWIPMILGLIASEVPRGDDFIFIRMGGATFCRTGMPLLVILLFVYSIPELVDHVVFMIVFVYATGFITSVLLSVFRLGHSPAGQKLNEVQSAIH